MKLKLSWIGLWDGNGRILQSLPYYVIIHLSYYIDKPMPHVFVTIARPLYLGSWQPDCNTGLRLVGVCPKPDLLL